MLLNNTEQVAKIKKLAAALYELNSVEVEILHREFNHPPVQIRGSYIAFVKRTPEPSHNPLADDIEHGFGYSEEQALNNLYVRLVKTLNEAIEGHATRYSARVRDANEHSNILQSLVELQKETRP